jgi:outer membrane protein OmpA-like peptidoglycan-associated protein
MKPLRAITMALLIASAGQPLGAFAQSAQSSFDLNGEWKAAFTRGSSAAKVEHVMIREVGSTLTATKITGDEYVPAGKVTVRGSVHGNTVVAKQVCASLGFTDPTWVDTTLTITDANHFTAMGGCGTINGTPWERVGRPTLSLDSAVLFSLDSATLKPEATASLTIIVAQLNRTHPRGKLLIAGYTDDTGSVAHNLDLSSRRAQSVYAWLSANGIAKSRLSTKGYGEANPRYPNTNDEARAGNRRVEIVVLG